MMSRIGFESNCICDILLQDTPAPGTSKRAIKPKTPTPKKSRRGHIEIEYEVEDSPQRQRSIK